ncbi:MFS transporter [Streptomyces sp. NPDC058374]|uniref:MFS transporter n=1 Tax=unclassified Streptomyces TaxID=2593676 RepID=UPI00364FD283
MAATTTDADTAPTGHPQRWLILGVICLAQLTVLLDNTVLNVAIPSLTRELDASTSDIQWMINAYSLVQSGLLLTAGSSADRYGRKKMLVVGLAVFGVGSLVAGLAQSSAQLIAARAGMGVGGALLITTTLAVVVQIFDDQERVRAIGLWATVNALGVAVGPLVGGLILDHYWWGAIFLINIPVAVLGLVAVIALVPESKSRHGERPDLLGALLSTVGMTGVVYAIISGPEHGWASGHVAASGAVGLAVLTSFVLWELRTPHPMLDMRFFRDRRFVGAVAGAVLIAFGMGGSLFLLTQHLQFVLGYGPLEAGLRIAPLAVTVVVLNLVGIGARLLPKLGTPLTIGIGMTLLSAGLAAIALLGGASYTGMLTGLIVMGIGIALATPAMANALMSAIPREQAGVGAAVNGTLGEFGNGLGVATLGAVLNSRFAALVPGAAGAASLPSVLADADSAAERQAVADGFASGLETSQLFGAVAVLLGGGLAALLLWHAERADGPAAGAVGGHPEEAGSAEAGDAAEDRAVPEKEAKAAGANA